MDMRGVARELVVSPRTSAGGPGLRAVGGEPLHERQLRHLGLKEHGGDRGPEASSGCHCDMAAVTTSASFRRSKGL
jgi:hypothetical protein